MNERLLIALVKNEPVLYDRYRPDFRDAIKRTKAWNAIAKSFNVSVEDCMRTWRNIRERYAKELKLLKVSPNEESKWSLYDSLAFLQPYIKPRIKLSNTQVVTDRANEVLLIAMVKKYPELYDKHCENFKSSEKRESAWNSIADVLPMPVEHCVRLWRNLRERYTKELKLMKTTSFQEHEPRWGLFKRLSFLEPHIRPRKVFTKLHTVNKSPLSSINSTQDGFVFDQQVIHKLEEPVYLEDCEDLGKPDDSIGLSSNDSAVVESAIPEYIVMPTPKEPEHSDRVTFEEANCSLTKIQHASSDLAFGNYIGHYLAELNDTRKKNRLKISIIQLLHGDDNPLSD